MRIGMQFSLTGSLAAVEESILDGAMLAVHEINARGGVLGAPLETAVYDDGSKVLASVHAINHLCRAEQVDVVVGGYTSASRLAMAPAIHENRSLLMYPTYFEGEETDPRIFYCGAIPNQFAADYLSWIGSNLGRRIFVVGSDYIYPRVMAEVARRYGGHLGIETVGERYVPLGETRFDAVVEHIRRAAPDVVLCNVVGLDSTTAFYRRFAAAGLDARRLPIAATVTTEIELARMPHELSEGHFMVATYFASLDTPVNHAYRSALRQVRGQTSCHAAQVGAYNAVHALGLAAEWSGAADPVALARGLLAVRFDANPEGVPFQLRDNHHSAHPAYVATAESGEYRILTEFAPRPADPWWSGRKAALALG
ncbi:urea ABC transporter substrate-binding protein [Tsukamurella soli]|uniref:Urea ABC transporter substrate-binding protein n=1 Tax=Tsukamurella soli TaxID=644556 RepID=A0ABP8K445_9ACTN